MTMQIRPPSLVDFIPDGAPFSPEQRAWLNGFLGGFLAPEGFAVPATDVPPLIGDGDDGEAPWHDPAMPLPERMKLAEGRPLPRRMMAAMAQQDCGQCGYNCADYSDVIAKGTEARLNLCVPGGKETARMLRDLASEIGGGSKAPAPAVAKAAPTDAPKGTRDNPARATFRSRRLLNKPGSEKETFHVEFDLSKSGLTYEVGDSFGVFAQNDPGLVDQIIAMIGASPRAEINGRTLRDCLRVDCSLAPAPDSLFELVSYMTGGATRAKARALAAGEDPDGDAATLDVMAVLQKFPGIRPHPEAFVEALEPLQPRLYSISSSPRADKDILSLTVDKVGYVIGKRQRSGLASAWLAQRATADEPVPVYIQKAHNFALPADPAAPIIMVGPGTGVAPFRAFLRERMATKAEGRNWLFFGHQRHATDFFYADELEALRRKGVLSRLSLAWSRDGAQKFYVQDRMRQSGQDVWTWISHGAHFYICGDAKRMARDVEAALVDIIAQYGKKSVEDAIDFVAGLKKAGRYQADVY